MQVTISPGNISGSLAAPPSKSMTQRAYAAALLHTGTTIIHNAGTSDDEQAALDIIQQLGAAVVPHLPVVGQLNGTDVAHLKGVPHLKLNTIKSHGINPVTDQINCGESGLAARLFTPIAAISQKVIRIQGSGTLQQRSMDGFNALASLGITFKDFSGHLPFTMQGPLRAADMAINASSGSQLLSGILFALSHVAEKPVTITVAGLTSKPYIDMTLQMLAHFGRHIAHTDYKEFHIDPAAFTRKDVVEVTIEADWSSAAAFLVAGAIAGDITIHNLNTSSAQADRAILDVLRMAGAVVSVGEGSITVKSARLQAFEFDATDCPDLFPVLSILAACCAGESHIKGVHRLFNKESNRAESISDMLQDFDVPFSLEDDSFCITGVRRLQGTVIDTYHDHRIAMAAAVGALRAGSQVDIMGAEAVNKSYPGFFDDLILCGGRCNFNS